jgi:hypothetical protein
VISVDQYAETFASGAMFVLSPHNLNAKSLAEFDAAVRPIVDAGRGSGFVVVDPHTESHTGQRLYDLVRCERL